MNTELYLPPNQLKNRLTYRVGNNKRLLSCILASQCRLLLAYIIYNSH